MMYDKSFWIYKINHSELLFRILRIDDKNILYDLSVNNIDSLLKYLNSVTYINFDNYNIKFLKRTTRSGYFQDWHIDGRIISKSLSTYSRDNYFNDCDYLVYHAYKTLIVKYTILFYLPCDFSGGEIEFANNYKIKPDEYMCIFFDSRIPHRVLLQTSGIRMCYFITLNIIN